MKASGPVRVMKFGGTSLGTPERIAEVAEILVQHAAADRPVVVVSAMAGITELLLEAADAASRRENERWQRLGERLRESHLEVGRRLLPPPERAAAERAVESCLGTFTDICSGFSLVRETTPRALDSVSSLGELLAAHLLAAVLRSRGLPARELDAVKVIVTDDRFGSATPLLEETRQRIAASLRPLLDGGELPIVTGFRAATPTGSCTTLGRGGSDYSATILGSLLPADEIWIWTDVDGIMTADPRLVETAHVIPEVSYQEAIELSFFGAKVLHPKSIELPQRAGIPVWIKNTFTPGAPGTRISLSRPQRPGVRAIAHTTGAQLFTVAGAGAISFPRLAAAVFAALDAEQAQTLMVTQSSAENVICFAVRGTDGDRVRRRLDQEWGLGLGGPALVTVEVMPEVGMVVAVGEAMKGTPGIAARLFGALAQGGINVVAISQGSSELSISAAVRSADVELAVRAIHFEFAL